MPAGAVPPRGDTSARSTGARPVSAAPMDARDSFPRKPTRHREPAQCYDHIGIDYLDLTLEKRLTRRNLVRQRITISGRPRLHDVGDEHFVRVNPALARSSCKNPRRPPRTGALLFRSSAAPRRIASPARQLAPRPAPILSESYAAHNAYIPGFGPRSAPALPLALTVAVTMPYLNSNLNQLTTTRRV